jgi:phosphoketolase
MPKNTGIGGNKRKKGKKMTKQERLHAVLEAFNKLQKEDQIKLSKQIEAVIQQDLFEKDSQIKEEVIKQLEDLVLGTAE